MVVDGGDGTLRFVLTGGIEIVHAVSPRISLVFGARYAFIDRQGRGRTLGIGSSMLRAGSGLRLRWHW